MATQAEEKTEPAIEVHDPPPTPEPEPPGDDDETHKPEEPAAPAPAPEPEPQLVSEREIEQAFEKLDREAKRHRGRLDEILAEAALTLVPCPLCQENLAGWYWPEQLNAEHAQAVIDALTGFAPDEYKSAAYARECEACGGLGSILTGSRVPERRTMPCRSCAGFGYLTQDGAPPAPAPAPVAPVAEPGFGTPTEPPADTDFMGRTRDDPNFGRLAGYEV